MRDALGGTVNIVIVVFFIVIVLAYLAFNVNYTKAFRMKNKIISTYDDFNGVCDGECKKIIHQYAMDVGYSPGRMACENGWSKGSYGNKDLYCYKNVTVSARSNTKTSVPENNDTHYYKIATEINIEIPIIQNIFSYQMFWVTGDTKSFPDPKK